MAAAAAILGLALQPAVARAMAPPSCAAPAPEAKPGGGPPQRLVGAPPIRIDLREGRFCGSDCPSAEGAAVDEEFVVADGIETVAGGLEYSRLEYNPRLHVYALYQSLSRTHQATRDTVTLIDCRIATTR